MIFLVQNWIHIVTNLVFHVCHFLGLDFRKIVMLPSVDLRGTFKWFFKINMQVTCLLCGWLAVHLLLCSVAGSSSHPMHTLVWVTCSYSKFLLCESICKLILCGAVWMVGQLLLIFECTGSSGVATIQGRQPCLSELHLYSQCTLCDFRHGRN